MTMRGFLGWSAFVLALVASSFAVGPLDEAFGWWWTLPLVGIGIAVMTWSDYRPQSPTKPPEKRPSGPRA
jgi:hypothetical protein